MAEEKEVKKEEVKEGEVEKEEKPIAEEKPAEKEPVAEEEEVEVPEKFKKLVAEIEKMSVLELAELVKILEKKFGVSAAAPVAVVAPGAPTPAGEAVASVEEKSSYNIELTAAGDKKIEVIKVVRDVTQKGLKEAKDIVDAVASGPQVVMENVKKEEAEEIKKKLEVAGAQVELK